MATDTSKLAPRIIVNENDVLSSPTNNLVHPITLIFGFSPLGQTNEMVVCNRQSEIIQNFGSPQSSAEKYFIDAGIKVVQTGSTAIMTRLPYDNDQSHTVKYVDYKLETPISMKDIATFQMESMTRQKDDTSVTILKEMHRLDSLMTQTQRISQVVDEYGQHIHKMTNEELVELSLDPQSNLNDNTIRIIDIRGEQYGTGEGGIEYTGIFPMFVSAPMAMYYQGKIESSDEMDSILKMVDVDQGIEMYTEWFRQADPLEDDTKQIQSQIVSSIDLELNFNVKTNQFHRNDSLQERCVKNFPIVNFMEPGRLSREHVDEVGLLVCRIGWDPDQQRTTVGIVESFIGKLGFGRNSLDMKVNSNSKYIRMYKNIYVFPETDFFVVDNQRITSLGMDSGECEKYINYKTSIIDPITFMLDSVYSDVDSIQIDTILDAGLSATAFAAYVAKTEDGVSYESNPEIRSIVNWAWTGYSIDENIRQYVYVWNEITKMFGEFCRNVRGDCIYIADGPRILNIERNYPIRNYTDMENTEMFNKYLHLFNGYTNNYVTRYWNWVYMEDMQWQNRGIWVPGSVVMGGQLSINDKAGEIWYAPSGQNRGLIENAYDVSVRTKQYNQENDILYSNQWNFFQIYQNQGVVVEGQKTLQTKKTSLDRINVRRMVCWIKQRLREISNRYKYEPNTENVRIQYRREIVKLLQGIQKTSGISDFIVECDDGNNTMETIDNHELHCKIGIKPIKAIEYIVIDIDIVNGQVGFGESQVVVND